MAAAAIVGHGENVQIAHRFPGRDDSCRPPKLLDRRNGPQMFQQFTDVHVGLGPIDAIVGRGGQVDAGGDGLFGFGAKTFQAAARAFLAGAAQLVERVDAQLAVQDGRFFRA